MCGENPLKVTTLDQGLTSPWSVGCSRLSVADSLSTDNRFN
jgi:hypothetical protein